MYVKKGGGVFLNHPFWAVGGSFGHEKWARELARRCPEDPKIGRSRPEERAKRLCEEKIVKTSKNVDPVERNAWFWWPGRAENPQKSVPKWLGRRKK